MNRSTGSDILMGGCAPPVTNLMTFVPHVIENDESSGPLPEQLLLVSLVSKIGN